MAALKKTKVKTNDTSSKKKSDVAVYAVDGDIVSLYNDAVRRQKEAEAEAKELKPELEEAAQAKLFEHNIYNPTNPSPSIKLEDAEGEKILYTFQSRYSAADSDVVCDAWDEVCGDKEVDINEYVQETITATFDSSVFQDENGDFSEERYKKFNSAIERAAKALGVENPLGTKKVVKPKKHFHADRWLVFPSPEQQTRLTEALPNTRSFKPVAS